MATLTGRRGSHRPQQEDGRVYRLVWSPVLAVLASLGAGGCAALAIQEMGQTRARSQDLLFVFAHGLMTVSGAAAAVVLALIAIHQLVGLWAGTAR